MAHLALEESDYSPVAYKHIHASGCRDLRDPEDLGEVTTLDELADVVSGFDVIDQCESDDEALSVLAASLKPCARKALGIDSRSKR